MEKAKNIVMLLKEGKSMPQNLRIWDSIYLFNKVWVSSFDQFDNSKIMIATRGWNSLNRAFLTDPDICATMPDQEIENENEKAFKDVTLLEAVVHGIINMSTSSPA